MQCVHRLQVAWKIQEWGKKSTENDLRDGQPCVVKMTIKDKVKYMLLHRSQKRQPNDVLK